MTTHRLGARLRAGAGLLAAALLLTGCSAAQQGATPSAQRSAEPVAGGTVTFGVANHTSSLDPTISSAVGAAGASELAAIYDVLLRIDPETNEYEFRTAESLTPNDDFSAWTLKLRPGIEFADGTPYDAAAVAASIQRHVAPGSYSLARGYVSNITDYKVVDDLTLEFDLGSPWAGFPYVLTTQAGFITSPTAVEKLGADLGTNPVGAGAGPFTVASYTPNESLVLERNPDYWGGEVYLDGIEFVRYNTGVETYEAFKNGEITAGFLRGGQAAYQALQDGAPGYVATLGAGDLLVINSADGHPGHDPLVRQAIAAAIDQEVVNQRVYSGTALVSASPFPPGFPWLSDDESAAAGTPYEPEVARDLVAKAKANGWDGTIRLVTASVEPQLTWALTIETLLEDAGFDVTVEQLDPSVVVKTVLVDANYDIASGAFGIPSTDGAYVQLQENIGEEGNRYGFHDDAFSEALHAVRIASTDDERHAAWAEVAKAWRASVPAVPIASINSFVVEAEHLHGVVPTSQVAVLFDKAWLEP